jgi:cell shape-determining protein MreD
VRVLLQIGAYFVLAVLVGALWRATPFEVVAPDIALLFALYLGITSGRSTLWEATLAALMIGYVHDVLAGAPRGLGSIILGVMCILTRGTTARLLVRGTFFIAGFAFVGSLLASAALIVVRISFDAPIGGFARELVTALGTAALTALAAPPVIRLLRSIDARLARTQREREALREGYLG